MKKSSLKNLLSGMCCSVCRHDFDEESITIMREEQELLILRINCPQCGKGFGIALLGAGNNFIKNESPLEFKECPEKISYDDVLDAHQFIDNLDKDWMKYIPSNLKNSNYKQD